MPIVAALHAAAERLRGQGSVADAVRIFLTTSPFRQQDRQHSVNVTIPPVRPTADSAVLMSAASDAVRAQFRPGFNYAKAGAVLTDLRAVGQEQGELDLFSGLDDVAAAPVDAARAKLMTAMDALNHRFGRDSVRLGSTAAGSSTAEIRVWATKQERRPPRFTTRWDEMPVVRA